LKPGCTSLGKAFWESNTLKYSTPQMVWPRLAQGLRNQGRGKTPTCMVLLNNERWLVIIMVAAEFSQKIQNGALVYQSETTDIMVGTFPGYSSNDLRKPGY
jgi:hypothetical protein